MRRLSIFNRDNSPRPKLRSPPVEREDVALKLLYDVEIEEPDEAVDSTEHIKYYMRMRDNGGRGRKEYVDSLTGAPKKRVDNEIVRIEKLRKSFFVNPTKKELVTEHLKCRKLWRDEARGKQQQNLDDLEKRSDKFEREVVMRQSQPVKTESEKNWLDKVFKKRQAQNEIAEPKRWELENDAEQIERRQKMFRNERRILNAIDNWDPDPKETSTEPTEEDKIEAETAKEKMKYNIKAGIMYFHGDGTDRKNEHVQGVFPHQKIPIEILLKGLDTNPILEPSSREDGPIRYFHLPTNNMAWVEKFLELYYSKVVKDKGKKGPAERLLAYQNWKGQIHGGTEHPVHARHLRPRCLTVQRDSTSSASSSGGRFKRHNSTFSIKSSETQGSNAAEPRIQNFSLFMPYLHWEIKSRQIKMAEAIVDINRGKKKTSTPANREKNKAKKEKNEKEKEDVKKSEKDRTDPDWARLQYLARFEDETGRVPEERSKHLGEYLMSIARLSEAMDYEADERLLRDFLHEEPPLHVRRTLDQSYFWTLQDTASRDRDQVVYRGTRGGQRPQGRIVMVDQLWMWILDEHTILTSFPRRWGRNKPDSSGVHKSLRDRLEQEEEITSVFDLALIIIDQCSRVFFDRTRPKDMRPEVMDIFGNAVASVTHKKTASYERFWAQLEKDSLTRQHHSKESARTYLDINPEGALLRECEDIVEELHMMGRIFTQQHQVVKDFKKYLDRLNGNYEGGEEVVGKVELKYPRVPKNTLLAAQELLDHILERRKEIYDLEEEAKRTNDQLHNLLALKQQQASIIEARLALERADQSNQQGRSVMLFTVVTILFLPLSFFTSIFGMNNTDWEAHPMSLHDQFRFMLPVSFAVIIISLMVAFNNRTRGRFVAFFNVTRDKLAKYTPFSVFFDIDAKRTIDRDYLKAKMFGKRIRKEMNENERKVGSRTVAGGIGIANGTGMGMGISKEVRRPSIVKVEEGDNYV